MDSQGLLLCSRYSVAPNYFGYCGPPKNSTLIDHLREEVGDREVEAILSKFDSLYLNLRLIAFENKLKDPFNKAVVEAYWIGNNLLRNIKNKDYVVLLGEKFELEKKIGRNKFERLKYKFLSRQILPHHSFHVFNIFKRTGNDPSFHTLETMDSCRIGFGKVVKVREAKSSTLNQNKYDSGLPRTDLRSGTGAKIRNIIVKTKRLIINNELLSLGSPIVKELKVDYKGKSFIRNFRAGDWVSFHWGFVCDILNYHQVKNLEFYTNAAIRFFNS